MNNKRYLILAVLGALIVGISCYLFLNSFMDRVGILVFSRDIKQGEIISSEDLYLKQYYKNELPDSYMTDKSKAMDKKIFMDRKKDDFISEEMLVEQEEEKLLYNLQKDEVLIALSIETVEPVLDQLNPGQKISIVSTTKDMSIAKPDIGAYAGKDVGEKVFLQGNYIDSNMFSLSENILYIDGYIIIRDLKVLDLEIIDSSNQNILTGAGAREFVYIYLKCSIVEAPYISALASNEKFKIILEGAG